MGDRSLGGAGCRPVAARAGAGAGVRRASEAVGKWLSARPSVLVWLAVLAAPILPWLTNLADFFPAAHLWGSVCAGVFVAVGVSAFAIGRWRSQPTERDADLSRCSWPQACSGLDAAVVGRCSGRALLGVAVVVAGGGRGRGQPGHPGTGPRLAQIRLTRVALLAQVAVPLLLFVLVAPLGASNSGWLVPAVALVVAALVVLAGRRARNRWSEAAWPGTPSMATVAVVTAYLAGLLRLPSGGVPTDEYHWGELLVQWDQVTAYGTRPFDDYIPAPGLNGFLYGAVNQVLGGDSITFQRAVQVCTAVLAVLIVVVASRVVGRQVAFLLAPAAAALAGGGVADRFAGVALSALILALPALWRRPLAWLGVWLLLVPCNLLFIPSSGTAFVVASAPAVVVQAVRWLRAWRDSGALDYAVLAGGVLVCGLLAGTLVDLLSFVATQGAANDVAWGLPLLPWQTPAESAYIAALDVIRMAGWWLGIPIAAALVFAGWRNRPQRGLILLAGSTILMAMALSPYVFGRIERSGLSRVGLASILILGLLLPLAVRGIRAPITGAFGRVLVRTSAVIVIAVVGVPAAVMTQGFGPYRPIDGPTVDGTAIGLPNLGTGPAAASRLAAAPPGDGGGSRPTAGSWSTWPTGRPATSSPGSRSPRRWAPTGT